MGAARTLFLRKGVAATTVDEITSAAGVAKGTFYLYFSSKEALLDDLRVEFTREIGAALAALTPPADQGGWPAFTAQLVRETVDWHLRHLDLHELLVSGPHIHQGPLHDAFDALLGTVTNFLRMGVAAGAYEVEDVEATASLLLDLIHAAGDRAGRAPAQADRVASAAAEMAWRSLRRTPIDSSSTGAPRDGTGPGTSP